MNYQITIVRTEKNENFAEDMKKYEESRRFNGDFGRDRTSAMPPQEEVRKNVLMVELTKEEWEKVKSEVIKTFK